MTSRTWHVGFKSNFVGTGDLRMGEDVVVSPWVREVEQERMAELAVYHRRQADRIATQGEDYPGQLHLYEQRAEEMERGVVTEPDIPLPLTNATGAVGFIGMPQDDPEMFADVDPASPRVVTWSEHRVHEQLIAQEFSHHTVLPLLTGEGVPTQQFSGVRAQYDIQAARNIWLIEQQTLAGFIAERVAPEDVVVVHCATNIAFALPEMVQAATRALGKAVPVVAALHTPFPARLSSTETGTPLWEVQAQMLATIGAAKVPWGFANAASVQNFEVAFAERFGSSAQPVVPRVFSLPADLPALAQDAGRTVTRSADSGGLTDR